MKKLILIPLLLICTILSARIPDVIDCRWNPDKKPEFSHVRCDEPREVDPYPYEVWSKYPKYYCIYEVYDGWKIPYGRYDLIPDLILCKKEALGSFYAFRACQLAYNFFIEHPDRTVYWHDDFDFVVTRIESKDR